jgi:hypothetical protein
LIRISFTCWVWSLSLNINLPLPLMWVNLKNFWIFVLFLQIKTLLHLTRTQEGTQQRLSCLAKSAATRRLVTTTESPRVKDARSVWFQAKSSFWV